MTWVNDRIQIFLWTNPLIAAPGSVHESESCRLWWMCCQDLFWGLHSSPRAAWERLGEGWRLHLSIDWGWLRADWFIQRGERLHGWLQPWGICEELLCWCRSSCRCLFYGWSLVFSSRWSSAIRNLSQYHMNVESRASSDRLVSPYKTGRTCYRLESLLGVPQSTWGYPVSVNIILFDYTFFFFFFL